MSELLLKAIVDKLDILELEIQQLKAAMPASPDYTAQLNNVKASIAQLQTDLDLLRNNLEFPTATILHLSKRLKECTEQLKQPLQQNIQHHHHLNKGIIISSVLLMLLAVCASWIFNLYEKQSDYKANDIKYRHLKLQANAPLRAVLYETDSLYRTKGEAMTDTVIQQEEARQRRMELREEADRKEKEAKQLREQAKHQ